MSIRVLQLVGPCADFQLQRTAALILRQAGGEFAIAQRTLGRGLHQVFFDWRMLRQEVTGREHFVVHAFGMRALAAAVLAGHRRVLFSAPPVMSPKSIRWLHSLRSRADVQVACASTSQHRRLVTRGVPIDRCHAIRPAVEFGRIPGRRRDAALRAALGIGKDDVVLLAPGESTRAAEHPLAVWTCGILHVLQKRFRLLLWGRGPEAAAATTLARRLDQAEMTIDATAVLGADVEYESLLGVADAALLTASGAVATLPIAMAMAAALPTVSVTNRLTAELLEDRHNALVVTQPTPRALAQRVLDLVEDRELAWKLGDAARTDAFEYFSVSRMLEAYRAVYRQMVSGDAVVVPETAVGAGARFHGRG